MERSDATQPSISTRKKREWLALSYLFTRPYLSLLLAVFFGLVTMAMYNANLRTTIGDVTFMHIGSKAIPGDISPFSPSMMDLRNPRKFLKPEQIKASREHVAEINFWQSSVGEQVKLRMAVTGCIKSVYINDIEYKGSGVRGCGLKKIRILDNFGEHIHPGVNTLRINIDRVNSNQISVEIFPSYSHWSVFLGLYLTLSLVVIATLRMLNFCGPITLVTLIALLFCCSFFYSTGYAARGADVTFHLDYITYLLTFHKIPPPYLGYQMYQPPLYHILCALAYSVWSVFTSGDPMYAARLLTLCMYIAFVIISLCIIRRWVPGKKYAFIASSIFLLWSMGIAHSTFINNDVLAWTVFAAAIYWLSRWYVSRDKKHLAWAFVFCGIAFLTKNTAFALPLMILGVGFFALRPWRIFTHKGYISRLLSYVVSVPLLLSLVFMFACAGANVGRTYYYKNTKAHKLQYIIGNAAQDKVKYNKKDSAANFVKFDYRNFVQWPKSQRIATKEPLNFWTAFLRSWVIGAESAGRIGPRPITQTLSLLFPIMLLYIAAITAWRYVEGTPRERNRMTMWALLFVMMIGSLMYARISYRTNTASHARYMYSITVVTVILFGQAIEWLERRHAQGLAMVGIGLAGVFTTLGATLLLGRVTQIFVR